MKNCAKIQELIVESAAFSQSEPEFLEGWQKEHLAGCADCQQVLQQELELSRLLEEPSPLPPAFMIERVAQRITLAKPVSDPSLSWAERFVWAASGAVAMYCWERFPAFDFKFIPTLPSINLAKFVPSLGKFGFSSLALVSAAALLFLGQTLLVYQLRAKAV